MPPKGKKKPAPPKKAKRRYIKSKSTKGKKKKGAPKSTSGLGWYQRIRSEVTKFYKEEFEQEKLDQEFVKKKSQLALAALKKMNPTGITERSFKQWVVNMDVFFAKSPIELLNKEDFTQEGPAINYWDLDHFFSEQRQWLNQFKEIVVDCRNVLPGNTIETSAGNAPEEINVQAILREIRDYFKRGRKREHITESDILWFQVFVSNDGTQVVFELVDNEPGDVMQFTGVQMPGGKKTGDGRPKTEEDEEETEEPTKTTEPTTPQLPLTRTNIAEEKRAAELHTVEKLTRKKKSYQSDINFNSKEIKKLGKLVEMYSKAGIDHADEITMMKKLKETNNGLFKRIDDINEELDKI